MSFFPEQLEQVVTSMQSGLHTLDTEIANIQTLPTQTRLELMHQIQTLRDTVQYLSQNIMEYKHEQKTEKELGKLVELANLNSPKI